MSLTIYKTGHKIPLEVDGTVFQITPLTHEQKTMIVQNVQSTADTDERKTSIMAILYVKYGVKGIVGAKMPDGSAYNLDMDDDGMLTEDCAIEILNSASPMLATALAKLASGSGVSSLPGVKILDDPTVKKKSSTKGQRSRK